MIILAVVLMVLYAVIMGTIGWYTAHQPQHPHHTHTNIPRRDQQP